MKTWKYRITYYIYGKENALVIENPIACKGEISRGVFSEGNKATVELYNLAVETRNEIYQDPYQGDNSNYIRIEAGYSEDDSMQQLFFGRVMQAYTHHNGGATEVITKIEAICVDLFNTSSVTFAAGTEKRDAIKVLASNLPNVALNALGNIGGVFHTPTTFDGNTLEQIQKITGGIANIDNDQLNVCLLNEVIDVPVPIISDDSILLQTPMRKGMQLEINFIMQPNIIIGQLVQIESKTFSNFNGQFKVIGLSHSFLFSESVAGAKTTKATLLIGDKLPTSTNSVKGANKERVFSKVKKEEIVPVTGNTPNNVYAAYEFLQKEKGNLDRLKWTLVTSTITWGNLIGNDNSPSERMSELSLGLMSNCYATATTLARIINKYYPGKAINVSSCWRSVRNNNDWGGVSNSKHLKGLAIDFTVSGVTVSQLYDLMRRTWGGGIGYIKKYETFVHVQVDHVQKLVSDV